jgi:chromate transporter
MALPLVIVTSLGIVYDHFSAVPAVRAALIGAAAGAAGLVAGTGLKMAWKIKPPPLTTLIGAAVFVAVALLQWPLVPVVLGALPLGVAAAAFGGRT